MSENKPRDKAIELVSNAYKIVQKIDKHDYLTREEELEQSVMIASERVQEEISELLITGNPPNIEKISFWQQVQFELKTVPHPFMGKTTRP